MIVKLRLVATRGSASSAYIEMYSCNAPRAPLFTKVSFKHFQQNEQKSSGR